MKNKLTPIRLYWGENYAPKPPAAVRDIEAAVNMVKPIMHLYPGEWQEKAITAIAEAYNFPESTIFLGNGIEGLLVQIFQSFITSGDTVVTLYPTFGAYEHNATVRGGIMIKIPVGLTTVVTASDILSQVEKTTKLIAIASPNTQTGFYHVSLDQLEEVVKTFTGIVIIDECYFGIGTQTANSFISKYHNVIVLHSASKSWGLAGIRTAFMFADPHIIENLKKHTLHLAPDPLPMVSYAVLVAALKHRNTLEQAFVKFKQAFSKRLKAIPGLTVYPSHSTFIPVLLPHHISIEDFISKMAKKHILLKDTSDLGYVLLGIPPKTQWGYVVGIIAKFASPRLTRQG